MYGPGDGATAIEELARVVEADVSAHVDRTRAELDRRDVALTYRPQAHHEAHFSRGDAALVGVGHDRRVEECRSFERDLASEVGAHEKLLVGGDIVSVTEASGGEAKVARPYVFNVSVTVAKAFPQGRQRDRDVGVVHGQNAISDQGHTRIASGHLFARDQQHGKDPAVVGEKPKRASRHRRSCPIGTAQRLVPLNLARPQLRAPLNFGPAQLGPRPSGSHAAMWRSAPVWTPSPG